jgi:hypothetical protein
MTWTSLALDAALEELRPGRVNVGDDQLEALERAGAAWLGTAPTPMTIEQPEPAG